jgi:hypothetical protein
MKTMKTAMWIVGVLLLAAAFGCGGAGTPAGDLGTGTVNKPTARLTLPEGGTAVVPEWRLAETAPVTREMLEAPVTGSLPAVNPYAASVPAMRGASSIPVTSPAALAEMELPELPEPNMERTDTGRSASELQQIALGNTYADSGANVIAIGASATLSSSAAVPAWAVYEVPLADTERITTIIPRGSLSPANTHGLWVGVGNYSEGQWDFFGPYTTLTPTVNVNLPAGTTFKGGTAAYVMVIVADGDSASLTGLEVNVEAEAGEVLPPEFNEAVLNAGLNANLIGPYAQTWGRIQIGDEPWAYFNEWYEAVYDPPFVDLQSTMATFFNAWLVSYDGDTSRYLFPDHLQEKSTTLDSVGDVQDMVLAGAEELGDFDATTHSATTTLPQAIADFVDRVGGTSDLAAYETALTDLSADDSAALGALVDACQQAYDLRLDMLNNTFGLDVDGGDDPGDLSAWFDAGHGGGLWACRTASWVPGIYSLYDDGQGGAISFFRIFDIGSLIEGSVIMADAIDNFTAYMAGSPAFADVSLDVDTPVGKVVIAGTGDDTHAVAGDGNGHAILIDLGGNDTYDSHAGGNASVYNGIALNVDVAGDDVYNNIDDPTDFDRSVGYSDDNTSQQGTGRFGIGMLVDYAGTDQYTGVRMAQGCGIFGVGVLADFAGDDIYDGEAFVQGAALGGLGLFYDAAGVDSYTGYNFCQGAGSVRGVGMLVDHGMESDTYTAVENLGSADPERPNYWVEAYNTNLNFAQGAGVGARTGWISHDDTNYIASGGYGVLFDQGGDEIMEGGTFCQGNGFFQGAGILIDLGQGNDDRRGHWYSNGATAHEGVAGLWDDGGNDYYENEVSIGIGGAHDKSITWFFDRGSGDDEYHGAGLSMGTGFNNAIGIMLDYRGSDTYTPEFANPEHETLGRGGWHQDGIPPDWQWGSIGIFVDAEGSDTYDPGYADMLGLDANGSTVPGDQTFWTRTGDSGITGAYEYGYGTGIDGS